MTTIYTPPREHPHLRADDPGLLAAVAAGRARLTPEQGLDLLRRAPLMPSAATPMPAAAPSTAIDVRTYVIDRNINYTNVCTAKCTFCAFRRDDEDARRVHARPRRDPRQDRRARSPSAARRSSCRAA